jgi:hypothetical protein
LEDELAELVENNQIYLLKLDDTELRCAYSGAIALVYPSLYEGFGLPIAEAMACGCPVITCRNSSLPEVAGEAVIYVDEYKVEEMVDALSKVQIPEIRQAMIERGLEQVKQFSWTKMAEIISDVFTTTAEKIQEEKSTKVPLIWQDFRKMQAQLQASLCQTELPTISSQLEQPTQTQFQELVKFQENLLAEELHRSENYIEKKQQELQELTSTLTAMKSSKFWKLYLALLQVQPSLLPLFGLVVGLNLLVLSNLKYTYSLLKPLTFLFFQFQDSILSIIGLNMISLTLILGIVGYLKLVDAKFLRPLRIVLISIGLILVLLH